MNIADTKAALAAALTAVSGVTVRAKVVRNPKTGDGWVVLRRVEPLTTVSCDATFVAVVILGADETHADTLAETLSVQLVDAATKGALHASGVVLETVQIPAGDAAPAPLYALTLTLTLEVE